MVESSIIIWSADKANHIVSELEKMKVPVKCQCGCITDNGREICLYDDCIYGYTITTSVHNYDSIVTVLNYWEANKLGIKMGG